MTRKKRFEPAVRATCNTGGKLRLSVGKKISASRINGPYRCRGKRATLSGLGESPNTNPNPSRGGSGIRLKIARKKLISTNCLNTSWTKGSLGAPTVARRLTTIAADSRFDPGPAADDRAQPRLGLRIAPGFIGTGFPQPKCA